MFNLYQIYIRTHIFAIRNSFLFYQDSSEIYRKFEDEKIYYPNFSEDLYISNIRKLHAMLILFFWNKNKNNILVLIINIYYMKVRLTKENILDYPTL